ncbi:MAG: LVIVD repeat-containing protein [Acidimicrobiales bacterium]
MRYRLGVVSAAALLVAAAVPALADGQKSGSIENMEVVGHTDLGGLGFNADVWVHDDVAYVGHWGFSDWNDGGEQRFCPSGEASGVKVVDVSDPAHPQVVSRLQNPPGTSAEDVVVYTAENGPLAGRDIAAAGLQVCGGSRYDTSFARGLMLWDVTDPATPQQLGLLDSGCCTRGVHEFEVRARADLGRTFAYASVPASEYDDSLSPSGRRDQLGRGDFRLFDITDPANPFEVSDWGVLADLGAPTQPALGCDPDNIFGHSVEPSDDGRLAFVAYWDSGFIALDLSDPADPEFLGNTTYPANADGDGHSSNYDDARELLFTADEDFCKTSGPATEKGFGYLRVYNYSDFAAPIQIGEFRTANSLGTDDRAAGDYTIHNPFLDGQTLYVSWYSDGVRVLDVSNPTAPTEVAHFVPPAVKNPVQPSQRGVLTNTAQVWGVVVDDGLVFASDMNSGLWILRRS